MLLYQNMDITIFTDGSSRGNPGPGGWAVVIIFFEKNNNDGKHKTQNTKSEIFELGGREKHTTNNRMELTAVIEALHFLNAKRSTLNATIYSDSRYVLDGITKWIS